MVPAKFAPLLFSFFFDHYVLCGVGHFLCPINIAQLRRLGAFTEDMQQMIARWKASRKQADIAEIFYPGEKEYLHYEKCKKQGLKLAEETVIN